MTVSMTLAETAYVSRNMPHSFKKSAPSRLLALVVAAATAFALVAASAAPAQAESRHNDTLKALAAIAAIALIAKAVKDNKHRDDNPAPVRSPRVPAVCAIEIGSGRGSVTGYAERCLRQQGFNYRLPAGCSTQIRIYGRNDRFYPARCLRNAGFSTRAH